MRGEIKISNPLERKGRKAIPGMNPGGREPMRDDNPTAKILIAKGISIMELSRRVEIDRRVVSDYMRGVRPWARTALRKISMELGVPQGMLTGEIPLPGSEEADPPDSTENVR